MACSPSLFRLTILTRNSHVESIKALLLRHGVPPAEVRVLSVPGGSKAAALLAALQRLRGVADTWPRRGTHRQLHAVRKPL